MTGEAGDVHLVNNQVLYWPAERLVALPVVVVKVDDDAAHGGRQIVSRPDGIVPVEKRLGVAWGVWVNEHLIAVEPKPYAVEILWPIDTVGVMSARFEALDMTCQKKKVWWLGESRLMIWIG